MKTDPIALLRERRARRLMRPWYRISRNLLWVLLCLGAATLITEGFYRLELGPQNTIVIFVLATFFISVITDGYVYGIVSAVAGVLLFDCLVAPPRLVFGITAGFPITVSIMLIVTLVTSGITAQIKVKRTRAIEKEARAELLYEINERLLSSQDVAAVAEEAGRFIESYLGRSSLLYQRPFPGLQNLDGAGPVFSHPLPGDKGARALRASDVAREAERTLKAGGDPGLSPTPEPVLYVPLRAQDQAMGVLCIPWADAPITSDDMQFILLIAGQIAQALHLQRLSAQQQHAAVVAETEKAHSSFLRAISHDLRTPLTSILGASSALMDNGDILGRETRAQLVRDIHDDAAWLLSMVENILSTTRIQSSDMTVVKTVEAVEEVVAEAVSGVRKRFPGCQIEILAPGRLLMAPMDAMLISQVTTNLLENALRHAGKPSPRVQVSLREAEGYAEFSVADDGMGIDASVMPFLFELQPETNRAEDASRGFGMGLSICKTIVEVHQGRIWGKNLPQGGAAFHFTLPLAMEE